MINELRGLKLIKFFVDCDFRYFIISYNYSVVDFFIISCLFIFFFFGFL